MTAWEKSFRGGTAGLLVVRQVGEAPISARKLLVQLAADALAVVLALFVLNGVGGSSCAFTEAAFAPSRERLARAPELA